MGWHPYAAAAGAVVYVIGSLSASICCFPRFQFDSINTLTLTHPWHPSVGPKVLFVARVLYLLFALVAQIVAFCRYEGRELAYFTIWNYLLQIGYYSLMIGLTLHNRQTTFSPAPPKAAALGFIGKFAFVLHEVTLVTSVLVMVVFWALLVPGAPRDLYVAYYSMCAHLINAVILLVDFSVNRWLVIPRHMPFILLWSAVYCLFSVIFQFGGGFVPYFFIDIDSQFTLAWLIGLLILFSISHLVICWLSTVKAKAMLKKGIFENSVLEMVKFGIVSRDSNALTRDSNAVTRDSNAGTRSRPVDSLDMS